MLFLCSVPQPAIYSIENALSIPVQLANSYSPFTFQFKYFIYFIACEIIYFIGCFLGETSSTHLSANHDLVVCVIKRHPPWADELSKGAVFSWTRATVGQVFACPSPGNPFTVHRLHTSPVALSMAHLALSLFLG